MSASSLIAILLAIFIVLFLIKRHLAGRKQMPDYAWQYFNRLYRTGKHEYAIEAWILYNSLAVDDPQVFTFQNDNNDITWINTTETVQIRNGTIIKPHSVKFGFSDHKHEYFVPFVKIKKHERNHMLAALVTYYNNGDEITKGIKEILQNQKPGSQNP